MRKGFLNVTVAAKLRTSLAEAGVYELDLPNGSKVVALGHMFFPDHDRKLFDGIIYPMLRREKPDVIFVLGGGIHDNAFQELAPKKAEKTAAIHRHELTPEVAEIAAMQGSTEQAIMALGAKCGDFFRSLSDAAGGATVLFIPSVAPLIPSEAELMKFLYYMDLKLKAFYDRNEDEAPSPEDRIMLPTSSEDFARLLGLENDEYVRVLRFGSGVMLNSEYLFLVGDFRRRNALTGGTTELDQRNVSLIKGFDGKLGDGYSTEKGDGLRGKRRYLQFHEVPNLFDRVRLGDQRDYDRWAQGFFLGSIVGNVLHGKSHPIIPGVDDRRCVVVNGVGYVEETPTTYSRGRITLARRKVS